MTTFSKHLLSGILITSAILCSVSWAQSNYYVEYNKTIAHLGVQGGTPYAQFIEGTGQPCNEVYLNPDRKSMYAALLAAKISQKKLSRLDYSVTNGVCSAEVIEVAP